jgi:hypothetical protein
MYAGVLPDSWRNIPITLKTPPQQKMPTVPTIHNLFISAIITHE